MAKYRLFPIAAILLAFALSCGVKTSPRPPADDMPARVGPVKSRARENFIMVTWMVGAPGKDVVNTRAVAFDVHRRSRNTRNGVWSRYSIVGTAAPPSIGNKVEWKDSDVEPDMEYEYRVAAVDADGTRGKLSKPSLAMWTEPPGKPREVSFAAGDRSVSLDWNEPADGPVPEGYMVYRAREGGVYKLALQMPVPESEYFDAGLKNGVKYRYTIRAVRSAGTYLVEGPASDPVETVPLDTTPPAVPLGVGAFDISDGVKIIWWPNEDTDIAGYNIYRSRGGNIEKLNDGPVVTPVYMDKSALRRKSYRYTVTAVDDDGNESRHSEPARVYIK